MFFIFGSPRSGTTLLAQCLDSHPDIVVPDETDFIIPLAFIFDRIRNADVGRAMIANLVTHAVATTSSLGEYLSPETLREVIGSSPYEPAAMLEAIYAELARRSGARLAGDKSPNDLLFLRMLVKVKGIGPDTKIVHLVRDIRDVMVSLNQQQWAPDADLYFPRFWSTSNLYLRALFHEDRSRYRLVRYEDMVRSPQPVYEDLCRFLGVAFDPGMLACEKRHGRYRKMAHHRRLFEPITTSRIGLYRSQVDNEMLGHYERQAHEGLEVFGYLTEAEGVPA